MKVVKEHINEKFSKDSDPVHDLGIGIYGKHNFDDIKEFGEFLVEAIPAIMHTDSIPKDIIYVPAYLFNPKYFFIMDSYIDEYVTYKNKTVSSAVRYDAYECMQIILRKKGFKRINKHDELHEKFRAESDPIEDLNIGFKSKLKNNRMELFFGTITEKDRKYLGKIFDNPNEIYMIGIDDDFINGILHYSQDYKVDSEYKVKLKDILKNRKLVKQYKFTSFDNEEGKVKIILSEYECSLGTYAAILSYKEGYLNKNSEIIIADLEFAINMKSYEIDFKNVFDMR